MKKKKSRIKERGFAALKKRDPERLLEVVAKGGRAAHEKKVAHMWTSETARQAALLGWEKRYAKSNRANA